LVSVIFLTEWVMLVAARHGTGVLVITHYERILKTIKPQFVHVLFGGRIVENGGPELAEALESKGYDWVREKYPEAAQDEEALEAAQKQNTNARMEAASQRAS
jgi:Fe-S cluster assembly ATP-binding protein